MEIITKKREQVNRIVQCSVYDVFGLANKTRNLYITMSEM